MKAMLASNTGRLADLQQWIMSDLHALEQKVDGDRMMVTFSTTDYSIQNREGEPAGFHIPRAVHSALRGFLAADVILDGELVDKTWWVFDCPSAVDTRSG